jgi:hypothetical protein
MPLHPYYDSNLMQKTTQHCLEDELQAMMGTPMMPSSLLAADSCKLQWFDTLTMIVYTGMMEGRAVVTDQFLNACCLLAHHSTSRQLMVYNKGLSQDSNIYVREPPYGLFHQEILNHLPKYPPTSGFMYQF